MERLRQTLDLRNQPSVTVYAVGEQTLSWSSHVSAAAERLRSQHLTSM